MEFEEITIENFGTIEHITLALNTPGMILITGLNKDAPKADSNGAGKSLLLDAICWCLWGETVRGLTTDSVIRRQVGKDCAVTLKFSDGDTKYIVSRHRKDTRIDKPNDLRLFINGVEKTKKMKNLQENINQIVGFDFDTFCVMMPGTGVSVATMTDSKIKEHLEKLMQTEQLTAAYSAVRERLRALEAEKTTQQASYNRLMLSISSLEKEVAQLRELEQSFAKQKADSIKAHTQRIEEYKRDIFLCNEEIQKKPKLEAEIKHFKEEIDKLQNHVTNEVIKPAKAAIKLIEDEISTHETSISFYELTKRKNDERLASISKLGGQCPTCDNVITEDHIKSCREVYAQELQKYESSYLYAKQRLKELTSALKSEQANLTSSVNFIRDMMDIKNGAIKELQRALDQIITKEQLKAILERDLAREEAALLKAETEQHNFTDIFKDKTEKAVQLAQEVCQVLTKQRELEKEEKLCKFWVDGFSPAGLRSYMLDFVTPILNDRAAYYSNLLTGGEMKVTFSTKTVLKKGGEKDQFQILVEQKHGGDLYKGTSKGEKARADLVIAMALGDLATFRTAKQLPWRFLDEPFENIDDAGNEAVVQLLNDQKSRYKTVFVVTHKPAFKKLFNQRITVVKENGISRLTYE